jgi:hypothetical protein
MTVGEKRQRMIELARWHEEKSKIFTAAHLAGLSLDRIGITHDPRTPKQVSEWHIMMAIACREIAEDFRHAK